MLHQKQQQQQPQPMYAWTTKMDIKGIFEFKLYFFLTFIEFSSVRYRKGIFKRKVNPYGRRCGRIFVWLTGFSISILKCAGICWFAWNHRKCKNFYSKKINHKCQIRRCFMAAIKKYSHHKFPFRVPTFVHSFAGFFIISFIPIAFLYAIIHMLHT